MQDSPLSTLVTAVREAVAEYDKSGDHVHRGAPYPGDCIRCALKPFIDATDGAFGEDNGAVGWSPDMYVPNW